jgi:predicted ester cyclase
MLLVACSWFTPTPEPGPAPTAIQVVDHRATVDTLVAAVNAHDVAKLQALTTGEATTPATSTADFVVAFPDGKFVVEDVISARDRAAARLTFTGTHEGPLLGVPPSHRPVKFEMTWWLGVGPDGRVTTWTTNGDVFTLFAQIGSFPAMPVK